MLQILGRWRGAGWTTKNAPGVLWGLLLAAALTHALPAAARTDPGAGGTWAPAAPIAGPDGIALDGRLDDAAWQRLPPTGGFLQREPSEGADASFDTEFRVAFDKDALYVGVMAYDPEPARIVGLRTRRDSESPSDWIRVLIDSWHDRRTAFEFAVNPAGVRQDRYWFNDTSNDEGWDAVWDVAVARSDRGWSTEFRIPLSQLRFNPRGDSQFGFAVVRQIARLNETSSWPLLAKSAQGYVSSFGQLSGLSLGSGARRLELVPYVVSDITTQEPEQGDTLASAVDPGARIGVDFKYAVTPGVTLTGTVNPDFGQVEADPAVVNLSAFETFFPERRPFFLEGSGIFRFDLDCEDDTCSGLFYSRRIGRTPRGEPDVSETGSLQSPAQTTILGAAKLTGRAGPYSFGALTSVTSDERATVQEDGSTTRPVVEPATSYSVFRTRREWDNQSSLGMMVTAANRRVPDELRDLLPSQAYSGGLDADLRLSRRFRVTGYWAASTVKGDPAAIQTLQENARHLYQRPDATYVTDDPSRTSLAGHAGMVSWQKNGGERVRFNANVSFKTPGFDVNELGFLVRADSRQVSNWLQLRNDRPWRFLRSARLNFNQWSGWNFGGDRISSGGNINGHLTFGNNWQTGVGVTRQGRILDDRLTRGGPGGYREARTSIWGYVNTDRRQLLSAEVFGFGMRDEHGTESWELGPELTLRPSTALSMSVSTLFSGNRDAAQWVEGVEEGDTTHYVFGSLNQKTTAVALRVNYAVSPTLSLQLYGRPFVSTGDFRDYQELVDGRAPRFEDRYAPFSYQDNADFRYRSFRMTNVLRWEYRPGSALFVVWQQGREAEDEVPDGPRDLGSPFSAPARNVFLVKLAYWLNP